MYKVTLFLGHPLVFIFDIDTPSNWAFPVLYVSFKLPKYHINQSCGTIKSKRTFFLNQSHHSLGLFGLDSHSKQEMDMIVLLATWPDKDGVW